MESKIHIKVGGLELDCKGSESFVREELPKILDAVSKFRQSDDSENDGSSGRRTPTRKRPDGNLTTASIASRSGAKSGPDLAQAAAAKLTIFDGLEEFSRDQLHDEMKSAKAFFKKSYTGNLSKILNGLCKSNKLNEVKTDSYSLPGEIRADFEVRLG